MVKPACFADFGWKTWDKAVIRSCVTSMQEIPGRNWPKHKHQPKLVDLTSCSLTKKIEMAQPEWLASGSWFLVHPRSEQALTPVVNGYGPLLPRKMFNSEPRCFQISVFSKLLFSSSPFLSNPQRIHSCCFPNSHVRWIYAFFVEWSCWIVESTLVNMKGMGCPSWYNDVTGFGHFGPKCLRNPNHRGFVSYLLHPSVQISSSSWITDKTHLKTILNPCY